MEITWAFEKTRAGRQQERLSRCVPRCIEPQSIRGLSSREDFLLRRFDAKIILREARIFMGQDLWTKLDRCRPVSQQQYQQIRQSLNRAAMTTLPDYPCHYPRFRYGLHGTSAPGCKRTVELKSIAMKELDKVASERGPMLLLPGTQETIEINGLIGRLSFSIHAIDRFRERLPVLVDYVSEPSMMFRIAAYIIRSKDISIGHEPMLAFSIPLDGTRVVLGHFALKYTEGYWLATSFLLPDMRGTPEKVREGIRSLTEKYAWDSDDEDGRRRAG